MSVSYSLDEHAAAIEADLVAGHTWRDERNFAGLVTGVSTALLPQLLRTASSYLTNSVGSAIWQLETYALNGPAYDNSSRKRGEMLVAALEACVTALGWANISRDMAASPTRQLTELLKDAAQGLAASVPLQRLQRAVFRRVVSFQGTVPDQLGAIDLDRTNLRWAARPWIHRDLYPSDPLTRAFETALTLRDQDYGVRMFAYELFSPLPE